MGLIYAWECLRPPSLVDTNTVHLCSLRLGDSPAGWVVRCYGPGFSVRPLPLRLSTPHVEPWSWTAWRITAKRGPGCGSRARTSSATAGTCPAAGSWSTRCGRCAAHRCSDAGELAQGDHVFAVSAPEGRVGPKDSILLYNQPPTYSDTPSTTKLAILIRGSASDRSYANTLITETANISSDD